MIRRHTQPKEPARDEARIVRRTRTAAPTHVVERPAEKREGNVGRRRTRALERLRATSLRGRSWLRAHRLPIAAATVLAVLVGLAAWAWFSPLLRVQEVEVVGAISVSEQAIIQHVDFWDERMLTADLGATAEAITALPLVAGVSLERRWPDTVRITVREREPWGSWEQAGVRYTIDREAVVLGRGEPPTDSITIVSNESYSLRPGDRVDYHAVDAAAEVTSQIRLALSTSVIELTYSPDEGIRVRTADGQTALLGDSSGIAYKLAVWARVVQEAKAQEISYSTIDLRFGDRPVLR